MQVRLGEGERENKIRGGQNDWKRPQIISKYPA